MLLKFCKNIRKHLTKKNTFLGIKYDNETLIESILEAKIPKETKKEYLIQIKNALIERIENLTGDASHISKLFDAAIDSTLSKGLRASSKALDNLVNKFLDIIGQLETMNAKNKEKESCSIDQMLRVPEIAEPLQEIANILNVSIEDIFGNGYFDGSAKQKDGNCWAHADLNNMLQTEAGKQYINNLIVRTNNTTSVYLPGAKYEGLPKPKGDGIFTYDNVELYVRAADESLGDGDYTAFMMAITDYRKMSKVNPGESSSAGGNQFNYLIFGKDYEDYHLISSVSDEGRNIISDFANQFLIPIGKSGRELKRLKNFYKDFDPNNLDTKTRYENFKKLFNEQKGYFSISVPKEVTNAKAKVVDTGEEVTLLNNHAYSITEIKDNCIILQESNNPTQKIEVDYETFMTMFNIFYNKFPDNM